MAPKQQARKERQASASEHSQSPECDNRGDEAEKPQRTAEQQRIYDMMRGNLASLQGPLPPREGTSRPARQQPAEAAEVTPGKVSLLPCQPNDTKQFTNDVEGKVGCGQRPQATAVRPG